MSSEFSASNLVFLLIFFNGVEMVMFATYYCLVKKRNVVVINVLDDFFFFLFCPRYSLNYVRSCIIRIIRCSKICRHFQ